MHALTLVDPKKPNLNRHDRYAQLRADLWGSVRFPSIPAKGDLDGWSRSLLLEHLDAYYRAREPVTLNSLHVDTGLSRRFWIDALASCGFEVINGHLERVGLVPREENSESGQGPARRPLGIGTNGKTLKEPQPLPTNSLPQKETGMGNQFPLGTNEEPTKSPKSVGLEREADAPIHTRGRGEEKESRKQTNKQRSWAKIIDLGRVGISNFSFGPVLSAIFETRPGLSDVDTEDYEDFARHFAAWATSKDYDDPAFNRCEFFKWVRKEVPKARRGESAHFRSIWPASKQEPKPRRSGRPSSERQATEEAGDVPAEGFCYATAWEKLKKTLLATLRRTERDKKRKRVLDQIVPTGARGKTIILSPGSGIARMASEAILAVLMDDEQEAIAHLDFDVKYGGRL